MATATMSEKTRWTIEGRTEDGEREVATIQVAPDDGDGYTVVWTITGYAEAIEHAECETLDEALEQAEEWARAAQREYRTRERERVRAERQERRDALRDLADEFDGIDKAAVRELANLLGNGRGAAALAALKALTK